MSEAETRALIVRFLDAFNAGDRDAMLACLADDVTHDINQGGREIGREKFRWFVAERARHFDERAGDVLVMVDEGGGRAAAEFTLRGSYTASAEGLPEASGQHYSVAAGAFFEIDGRLISRFTPYYNLAELKRQLSDG